MGVQQLQGTAVITKIPARTLRPGMYVHDLGCNWVDHPFLLNRFLLRSADQVRAILDAGITEVAIDTERGADAALPATPPEGESAICAAAQPEGGPAPPVARIECPTAAPRPRTLPRRTITQAFREAKRVHDESCRVVRDVLADARLGKQVCMARTQAVVTRIADSILQNPGPLLALCRIKQKDEYTYLHSVSVGALLMVLARAAGEDEAQIREAGIGGLLHDIGKMVVPPEVLNKPGALSEPEMDAMRRHVAAGNEILEATPGVTATALQVAAEHHERHDGSGYPRGLMGESISRFGKMAAIVDVYDAITSDRVYRRGLTPAEALKLLLRGSGSHFDPALVQLLIKTVGIYPAGSLVMLESGRLAVVIEPDSAKLLQPRVRIVYDTRKGSFVMPQDVDLARPSGHGGADRILRHESPLKWSLNPLAYLLEEMP